MSLNVGTRVVIAAGRREGRRGTVVAICPLVGWFFLELDQQKQDPGYRHFKFGPFAAHELQRVH